MKSTMTAIAALVAGGAFLTVPANAQSTYGAQPAPQQRIPDAPQEQAQPQQQSTAIKTHTPKVSGSAGKAVTALQKAVLAKDTAAIPGAVAAAKAAAKSADDHYAIAMFELKAAADAKDNAAIAGSIEAMLASGAATEDEKFPLYVNLAKTYSSMKQAARAADAYAKALQLEPSSIEATAGLAEAKVAAGNAGEGLALLQKGIALQSAGGARADESWYKRAVAIAFKAKLPQAVAASRTWLEAYPSQASWHDSLAIFQNLTALDESTTLDLMRLKRATGALDPADYFNYGDIAVRKGFSGEAKAILEEGFAASKVKRDDPSFSQLYAVASQKTKGDRESLPAAPDSSSTAHQMLVVGDAWYGYGEYLKAAEFYRAALAKGGADANTANLHLGMALARQGDKAGAAAALAKVTGPGAELARFWQIYLNTKA